MNPKSAKLATLEQLIGLMDDRMLGKLKRKGQPAAAAQPPAAAAPETPAAPAAETDDTDAESLKQLMDMYGKDTADQPVDVNSTP